LVKRLARSTRRAAIQCSPLIGSMKRGSLQSRKTNHGQNHVDRGDRIDE
jgi:hypothetical protein